MIVRPEEGSSLPLWKAVLSLAFGLCMLYVTHLGLHYCQLHWSEITWAPRTFAGVAIPLGFFQGVILTLNPFRRLPLVRHIWPLFAIPLNIIMNIGHFYSYFFGLFMTALVLGGLPSLIWDLCIALGYPIPLKHEAYAYLAFTLLSIIMTRWGGTVIGAMARRFEKGDYTWLTSRLGPSYVRFYIYLITAAAYFAKNFGDFSGPNTIQIPLWGTYQKIVVEVLLTYVALDAVVSKWYELRTESPIK